MLLTEEEFIGFGDKGSRFYIAASIGSLDSREASRIVTQLCLVQPCSVVTKEEGEGLIFDLEIELFGTRRLAALLAGIIVEGVVGIRIDLIKELAIPSLASTIIRHGQQPLTLDASFGKEGNPALGIKSLFVPFLAQ